MATLGRWTKEAGAKAAALLSVLDALAQTRVRQAAADEIYVKAPVLMVVEPESLCWVTGQLSATANGEAWTRQLSAVGIVGAGGAGRRPRLAQGGSTGRCGASGGRPARGGRPTGPFPHGARRQPGPALHRVSGAARLGAGGGGCRRDWTIAFARGKRRRWRAEGESPVEASGKSLGRMAGGRAGVAADAGGVAVVHARGRVEQPGTGGGGPVADAAVVARRGLRQDQTVAASASDADLSGRGASQVDGVAVVADLREAAVRLEGGRRRPERLQGESLSAATQRALLLACTILLAKAGAAGEAMVRAVRSIFRNTWRSSSLVEGINSVLRMHQTRHRRLTQGLLDLKRLYWNCRTFRTGRRRGQSPYQRLGLLLPEGLDWWNLLKMTPEQLRDHVRAIDKAG